MTTRLNGCTANVDQIWAGKWLLVLLNIGKIAQDCGVNCTWEAWQCAIKRHAQNRWRAPREMDWHKTGEERRERWTGSKQVKSASRDGLAQSTKGYLPSTLNRTQRRYSFFTTFLPNKAILRLVQNDKSRNERSGFFCFLRSILTSLKIGLFYFHGYQKMTKKEGRKKKRLLLWGTYRRKRGKQVVLKILNIQKMQVGCSECSRP